MSSMATSSPCCLPSYGSSGSSANNKNSSLPKMYSKDFLLQYSHLKKKDPALVERVTPYLTDRTPKTMKKPTGSALPLGRPTAAGTLNMSGVGAGHSLPQSSPESSSTGRHQLYSSAGAIVAPPHQLSSTCPLPNKSYNPASPRGRPVVHGTDSHTPKVDGKPVRQPLSTATSGVSHMGNIQRTPQSSYGQKENLANPSTSASFSSPKSPRMKPSQVVFSPTIPSTPSYRLSSKSSPAVPVTPATPRTPRSLVSSTAATPPPMQPAHVPKTPTMQQTPPVVPISPTASAITPVSSPARSSTDSPPSPSKTRSPARPISPLDEQRLSQRQKQIDYGYRTVGYLRYRLLVAKDQRKPEHPRTPKKNQGCSKRSWDGQLKKWRRDLHLWDPDSMDAFRSILDSELVIHISTENPELDEIIRIVKEKMDNPLGNKDEDDNAIGRSSEKEVKDEEQDAEEEEDNEQDSPRPPPHDSKFQKVARTLVF